MATMLLINSRNSDVFIIKGCKQERETTTTTKNDVSVAKNLLSVGFFLSRSTRDAESTKAKVCKHRTISYRCLWCRMVIWRPRRWSDIWSRDRRTWNSCRKWHRLRSLPRCSVTTHRSTANQTRSANSIHHRATWTRIVSASTWCMSESTTLRYQTNVAHNFNI